MKYFLPSAFILFTITSVLGQGIKGVVYDENDLPLPYVSIYIKNTTTGTTSNEEGQYHLSLPKGEHTIYYQFVGYKTEIQVVAISSGDEHIDIVMKPQAAILNEVIIAADREDPAYPIIRNAIAKRDYYKNLIEEYSCDVYVKGNQKMLKAPEKILGQEVGDLDGMLDSNRQGIVYLSESISQLHVSGDDYKEVVTSSKLSGDDRGYSFNSAREMEMSFYDNSIELQRQMVSPIANNAFAYYKYRLEGVFTNEDGRLINKIKVIPKRPNDPAFYGTIYIVHQLWNIHSLELGATSSATQIYFIDSLTFAQVYIPLELPDKWVRFSNTIHFKVNIFGFSLKGIFTGVYNNYNLTPDFKSDFFDANVHVVERESNEHDSAYWEEVRPVPLTFEETVDYKKKDSIFEVRNDPIYMDSVDRKSSQFEIGDILGGYSYTRRSKQFYYDIQSPLSSLQYNTVQGYNLTLDVDFRKYFDEKETRRILFGGKANYGFSDNKLRGSGYLIYRPSRIKSSQLTLRGGSEIVQFNRGNPISPFLNSVYSLFYKRNHAKYLGVHNLALSYSTEMTPGVFVTAGISWEERTPLLNTTDFSFFNKDRSTYTSNDPLQPDNESFSFDKHSATIVNLGTTIRFKQKYILYPDRRFFGGNEGPTLRISYTGAFPVGSSDVSYQKVALSLEDEWQLGVKGRFQWYLNGGIFFDKERIEFRDYRHFMTSQIFFMNNQDYSSTFFQLPYYNFSTSDKYLQVHVQQHFDGFILDKIPGLQKLGASLVAGAKFLKSGSMPAYSEYHVGIDNLGYKFFRLARIDAVLSNSNGENNWGVRMSLGF